MINKDIIEAFSLLAKEKDIDRTNLSTIIEDIFMSLIYKKYGEERENFSVIVNMEKGEIEIYQEMTVVKKVIDPITEIIRIITGNNCFDCLIFFDNDKFSLIFGIKFLLIIDQITT